MRSKRSMQPVVVEGAEVNAEVVGTAEVVKVGVVSPNLLLHLLPVEPAPAGARSIQTFPLESGREANYITAGVVQHISALSQELALGATSSLPNLQNNEGLTNSAK